MLDLLKSPSYAVPLLVNLTGSVWFFVIIGGAGESVLVYWGLEKGVLLRENCADHILWGSRVESYGSDYEFFGVFVYGFGGVVGRGEGYI